MTEAEITTDQQDSIKIIKNTKGYSWEVKRYYDFEKTKPETIISELEDIDKKLTDNFGG